MNNNEFKVKKINHKELLKIKKQNVLWHGVDFFNAIKIIKF